MGTLGLVTIIRGGKVWAKVSTTCDGQHGRHLADALINGQVILTARKIHEAAARLGFGCRDCLVVITEDECVGDDDPPARFFSTLGVANRHPAYRGEEDFTIDHFNLVELEI